MQIYFTLTANYSLLRTICVLCCESTLVYLQHYLYSTPFQVCPVLKYTERKLQIQKLGRKIRIVHNVNKACFKCISVLE